MKISPLLMKGPLVRASMNGEKTQTRRIVKPCIDKNSLCELAPCEIAGEVNSGDYSNSPYGGPGDLIWVRETFRLFDSQTECACYDTCVCSRYHGKPVYRADNDCDESKWKPSIFMPRWASRLTLEIVSVRVERLQDISEEDAWAEGCLGWDDDVTGGSSGYGEFSILWQSINGIESWDANPWVWVIQYKAIQQNINEVASSGA